MRLITYLFDGQVSYGAYKDNRIVNLSSHLTGFPDVKSLFSHDGLALAKAVYDKETADIECAAVKLLRPLENTGTIYCIGVNYVNRNDEYLDNSTLPPNPSLFIRNPGSFVAHGENMIRPPESVQFDYEGEIAIVIGKAGRRIQESAARDHIAGLTLLNDGSVRDWLRHSKFNVTQGKNFDKSGSFGPHLVTTDEFAAFDNLTLTTRVNGEVRQHDTTANLLFTFEYILSYLSTFTVLQPGDIVATGTPTGAGARFDPPKYLVDGDIVEIEVDGIGLLRNPVADER